MPSGQIGYAGGENVNGVTVPKTNPQDFQRYLAAAYVNAHTNPIMSGGYVTGNGGRTYDVSPGTGLLKTPAGAVYLSWTGGPTKIIDVPSTTRTDVVVVDAAGQIDVRVESDFDESQYIILDRRVLPGGATATSRSTSDHRRNYAIPYGGSLHWFAAAVEYKSGIVPRPVADGQAPALMADAPLPFWVPTDRYVDLHVEHAIFGKTRGDNNAPYWPDSDARSLGLGWMVYKVYLDNILLCTEELEYNAGYTRHGFSQWSVHVDQGEHTLRVERVGSFGREPMFFSDAVQKRAPGFIGIRDAGVRE